jgi:hypothetical protein
LKAGLIAAQPEHCNHFLVALGETSCAPLSALS